MMKSVIEFKEEEEDCCLEATDMKHDQTLAATEDPPIESHSIYNSSSSSRRLPHNSPIADREHSDSRHWVADLSMYRH